MDVWSRGQRCPIGKEEKIELQQAGMKNHLESNRP
jgi:hypothetical protein